MSELTPEQVIMIMNKMIIEINNRESQRVQVEEEIKNRIHKYYQEQIRNNSKSNNFTTSNENSILSKLSDTSKSTVPVKVEEEDDDQNNVKQNINTSESNNENKDKIKKSIDSNNNEQTPSAAKVIKNNEILENISDNNTSESDKLQNIKDKMIEEINKRVIQRKEVEDEIKKRIQKYFKKSDQGNENQGNKKFDPFGNYSGLRNDNGLGNDLRNNNGLDNNLATITTNNNNNNNSGSSGIGTQTANGDNKNGDNKEKGNENNLSSKGKFYFEDTIVNDRDNVLLNQLQNLNLKENNLESMTNTNVTKPIIV